MLLRVPPDKDLTKVGNLLCHDDFPCWEEESKSGHAFVSWMYCSGLTLPLRSARFESELVCTRVLSSESGCISRQGAKLAKLETQIRSGKKICSYLGVLCAFARGNSFPIRIFIPPRRQDREDRKITFER